MTSPFIRLGHSNHRSKPIKVKVERCRSRDHFGYLVTDCSALQTATHNQQVASLFCRDAIGVFNCPSQKRSEYYSEWICVFTQPLHHGQDVTQGQLF